MITVRGGITHQEEARMGYNTDEIVQWLAALDMLEADLAAAGVGVIPDPDDDTYRWFEFEGLLRTIGADPAAFPGGWEDWVEEWGDRHYVTDFGELFAQLPILLTSDHPAMVRYRQAMHGVEADRQLREAIPGE
jgi:hypothetical protein